MKLNKFKVGSILVILLSFALLLGVGPAANAKTWEVDPDRFTDIENHTTGTSKLSTYGEDGWDISAGDTLVLTETDETYTQTGSSTIEIDVRNVTIKGSDTGDQYPLIERNNLYSGPNFLITAEGVTIENLRFSSTDNVNYPAIVVDLSDTCSCTSPTAKFKNLIIPTCNSNSYEEGILFTANWNSSKYPDGEYGNGTTDYQNVVFENLTIGSGVDQTNYGIHFDQYTGDVSSLDFSQMDISGCDVSNGVSGTGILFENNGNLNDVEIVNSHGRNYGIQDNNQGIVVDGSNVTEIADFNLKNVELKNNTEEGFLIQDNSTPVDGEDYNNLKTIERLKFEGEDSEISGNDRGVVISNGGSGNIGANLSEITFEDALIKNNESGGVAFYVDGVGYPGTEGSGLRVAHSEFNPQAPNQNENDQKFGLKVDTTGGIRYVNILNSEFHGHDGTNTGVDLNAGSNLENVVFENSSASYNSGTNSDGVKVGTGVELNGNFVSNVNVKLTGGESIHFRENGEYGIHVSGSIGVDGFHLVDEDGDSSRDIAIDENGDTGLKIANSDRGNLTDLMVSSITFDENGGDGVNISTNESGDISHVRFDDVSASENTGGSGILIEAARSFENASDVALLQNSELESNKSHGLHLQAAKHLKNPWVKGNHFVDNNASGSSTGSGVKMDAGIDVGDELAGATINGNVVTGNHHGIKLHGWKVENLEVSQNGQILDNGEFNVKIRALDTLQYVDVKNNVLINKIEGGEYGLHLSVDEDGASSNIEVSGNSFESGITEYCGGSGTGIYLNAKNVAVKENRFYRLDPAIEVVQEDSGPVDSPEESANHINDNNFEICCTTIEASALSTGQKVDATHNYWGEGETEGDVVKTIDGVEHVFYGDFRDDPVVIVELLDISELKVKTDDPKVNKTVEIEYTLKNVSEKTISGQDVRLIIKDPSGDTVINMSKEDVPELDPGDTYKNSHTFIPTQEGTYSGVLEVDSGAYKKTTSIDVSGTGPEPGPTDDYTPDWDKTGIKPAPVGGNKAPYLEITDKKDGTIRTDDVATATIRVFDVSGKRLLELDSLDSVKDLSAINDLENGIYLYTVDMETPAGDKFQSPVMKFVVKQ